MHYLSISIYIHTVNLATTEFVRKNHSSSRSLGRKWEDMILPGHENPRNCMDPDEMKMRWCLSTPGSPEYVLPVAQSTSITPVSPYTRRRSLTMYLEAVIERVKRCTWRPWSWTQRCTGRPWLSEFGDALAGYDRARLEEYLEVVDLEGGATAAETLFIGLLVIEGRELSTTTSAERWETGWERDTGWERETVDLGMMLYLMYAVLSVKSWSWHGEIERDDLTSCS